MNLVTHIRIGLAFMLFAFFSALADSAELSQEFPLGTHPLRHRWNIGDHKERLELDLEWSLRVLSNQGRTSFTFTAHNPRFAQTIYKSLQSRANSGFTVVARNSGWELKLKHVRNLSIKTDSQRGIWLRATPKVMVRNGRLKLFSGSKDLTLESQVSIRDNRLSISFKSLNIEDVSGDLDRALVRSLRPVTFDLPPEARHFDLRLEGISFNEQDNRLSVTVSTSNVDVAKLVPIFRALGE